MGISSEEAKLWKKKHTIDDNNITTWEECKQWGELGIRDEDEFNEIMSLGMEGKLKEIYESILNVFNKYLDTNEDNTILMALWVIGTYYHDNFETYPYLFMNAMKGSGKTRTLKLATTLANGEILTSLTESALFRTKGTIGIDEFESLASKDKQALRELLNAGYKKGSKVVRMKKQKVENNEEIVPEMFDVYRPILMANIWGMDEVLGDRCISITLEKSNNPIFIKLLENFSVDEEIQKIKNAFSDSLCSLCSVVTKKNINMYTKWNAFITTYYTLTTLTTHTTHTTLTKEEEEMFKKINETEIDGRNLELYFPLFLISKKISEEVFDRVLSIAENNVKSKRIDDLNESKDVLVYQFVSTLDETRYYAVKDMVHQFGFLVGDGNKDWLNSKWFGRALKRLVLVKDKRRLSDGMQVQLNVEKAKDKLKMFS